MTLLEWLQTEGRQKGWVARRLGVSPSLVSRWLNGEREPTADRMTKIEALTGGQVSARDWTGGDTAPPRRE